MCFPSDEPSEHAWRVALSVVSDVLSAYGESAMATCAQAAVADPSNADVLYDLGYQLIEQGLSDLAAAVLHRALRQQPQNAVFATELACALEDQMLFSAARAVLLSDPSIVRDNEMARYLLSYHTLMSGNVDGARMIATPMLSSRDDEMVKTSRQVVDMTLRAEALAGACPLDDSDLRGWHAVVNGGVLLHHSPEGQESMRGRYAWVQDSEQGLRDALAELQSALEAADIQVPRVFVLDERSSAVAGMAAALVLKVPAVLWPEGGTDEPGLLVAYELDYLEEATWQELAFHRPGQTLWVRGMNWTQRHPYTPDLLGRLHQFNTAPWGAQLVLDPETGEPRHADEDGTEVPELAARIAALSPSPSADDVAANASVIQCLSRVEGSAAAGLFRTTGQRRRQWLGLPVHSAQLA